MAVAWRSDGALLYDEGEDMGVVVFPSGAESPPKPIQSLLARGGWEPLEAATVAAAFEEEDHPRDNSGKFSSGSKPDMERLIDANTKAYTGRLDGGGFITQSGNIRVLGRGVEHYTVSDAAGYPKLDKFMEETGTIRISGSESEGQFYASFFGSPNASQREALAELGEGQVTVLERWGIGVGMQTVRELDRPSRAEVEGAVRQLSALRSNRRAVSAAGVNPDEFEFRGTTEWFGQSWRVYEQIAPLTAAEWNEEDHPRDEAGKFSEAGGDSSERRGELTAQHLEAKEQYRELKSEWSKVNNELLAFVRNPESPEAAQKLNELKGICKAMHRLEADPGGLKDIGLPGGPRDIVIVGAGPGGLSAAVMGATDGLDTLVIDANTESGGQAKYSSRIENYPGFPPGTSGQDLALSFFEQSERLGAESMLGVRVEGITHDPETGMKTIKLSNGEEVESRTVILAGGIEMRRLDFEGGDATSVIYGDASKLAEMGEDSHVVVIGGSNGAAQAALGAAERASEVTILARSPIERSMSDYQVNAIAQHPRINVIEGDEIASYRPGEGVTTKNGVEIDGVKAVGVFAGGSPQTAWLPNEIQTEGGRIVVDSDLRTTMPGVFAVGDIRDGGAGRIGAAVGDGQIAERNVFAYLEELVQKEEDRLKAGVVVSAATRRIRHRGPNAPERDELDKLIDQAFEVDEDNPFLSDMAEEPEPLTASWDENQHPRDESGRFGQGSGTELTDELVDELRDKWSSVEAGYEYTEALNQLSNNGLDQPEVLELRAAFVDIAMADRDAEYVGGMSSHDREFGAEDSPLLGLQPSNEMKESVYSWFRNVYESPDPAMDQTVTLYRGVSQQVDTGAAEAELNILSSWTRSPEIAGRFGRVMQAEIPLREIVDEGAIGEDEFVVFSPEQRREVKVL